jgi:hypothetical protein
MTGAGRQSQMYRIGTVNRTWTAFYCERPASACVRAESGAYGAWHVQAQRVGAADDVGHVRLEVGVRYGGRARPSRVLAALVHTRLGNCGPADAKQPRALGATHGIVQRPGCLGHCFSMRTTWERFAISIAFLVARRRDVPSRARRLLPGTVCSGIPLNLLGQFNCTARQNKFALDGRNSARLIVAAASPDPLRTTTP